MKPFQQIITHPGSAHKDEFLACCLLLTMERVPVLRRECRPEDLTNPDLCLVDVGHQHDADNLLFDHHQFPREQTPACSVSLILREMGLYEDALKFCDWLEPTEWFDTRGLVETAKWLGTEPKLLRRMASPVEGALLRAFSSSRRIEPGNFLWETMALIGQDIRTYLESLREKLAFIGEKSEIWQIALQEQSFEVFFLPRTDPLPEDPALGVGRYIEMKGWRHRIVAMIYPDRRGPGYGLSRFNDDRRLDFNRIAHCRDVHFTHANGFLAKTTALTNDRLRELLQLAWRGKKRQQ